MAAIGTAASSKLRLGHRSRRIVLALIGCGLVTVVTLKPRDLVLEPTLRDDGGLLEGQPISQLWVASRPEHAWFTDSQCRPLVTRFACDHCVPLVYLASFPRSGNTWTRYLLEASTGLFTVSGGPNLSQYLERSNKNVTIKENAIWKAAKSKSELVQFGYLGENIPWAQGVGIVAKTHRIPAPWKISEAEQIRKMSQKRITPFPNGVRRAVLLIRDPFKSLISLNKYGATHSVLNSKNMTYLFQDEAWYKMVKYHSQVWYNMNSAWLASTNETHVIAYERLTQDPMGELTSLLRFLHVEPDRRRMECLRNHLEGKAHNRQHGTVPDHQTYPRQLRLGVWRLIYRLNRRLRDSGHPALPLQRYSFADEFRRVQ